MPRPCKRRRVCAMPEHVSFGPLNSGGGGLRVVMTVDEYECIRLIDLEGLTQEGCASRMDVGRATVQAIYDSARSKLAEALVRGRQLVVEGGEYALCAGNAPECGTRCRFVPKGKQQEETSMKIAVTYENGMIYQHFGHTAQFKIYQVEDGQVKTAAVVDTNGSGHGALAGFLVNMGVRTLICGGIGGGARQALAQAGITLYGGVAGEADAAVDALLSGGLNFDPDVRCSHHDGEAGHSCGSSSHDCGSGEHHCGSGCHH